MATEQDNIQTVLELANKIVDIGKPLFTEASIAAASEVKYWRLNREIVKLTALKANMRTAGIDVPRKVAPTVFLPALEAAALEEDETLAEMWDNLLLEFVNPKAVEPHRAFAKALQELQPKEAALIDRLASWPEFTYGEIVETWQTITVDLEGLDVAVANLLRVQILHSFEFKLEQDPRARPVPRFRRDDNLPSKTDHYRFTAFGRSFVDACRTKERPETTPGPQSPLL